MKLQQKQGRYGKSTNNCRLYWNPLIWECRLIHLIAQINKIPLKYVFVTMHATFNKQNKLVIKPEQLMYNKIDNLQIKSLQSLPILVDQKGKVLEQLDHIIEYCMNNRKTKDNRINSGLKQSNQYNQNCLQSKNISRIHFMLKPAQQKYNNIDFQAIDHTIKQWLSYLQKKVKNIHKTQKLTVKDLVLYFKITDLVYFGKMPFQYRSISKFFKQIYSVPQVKTITHQWFPLAKQISKQYTHFQIQSKL